MQIPATTSTHASREPVAPGLMARLVRNLMSTASRHGTLAVVDQAVVSGASFATTIVLGRFCGAEQLGIYALGIALLVVLGVLQESLIVSPYSVFSNRRSRPPSSAYLGSVLGFQLVVMTGGALLLSAGAAAAWLGSTTDSATALLALALVAPWYSLRNFVRRMLLARLRVGAMLALDLTVVSLQFCGFAYLLSVEMLSAVSALFAIGLACSIGGVSWWLFTYDRFAFARERIFPDVRRHWSLGRWICAGQLSDIGQRYILHWMLAALIGVAATGIYSAYVSILLVLNPLVMGAAGVLVPHAARAFRQQGKAAVRRAVWKVTALLAAIAGAVCVTAALLGESIVQRLFSAQYSGYGLVMFVLAASTWIGIVSIPAEQGLLALKRANVNFRAGVLGLAVTCIATIPLAANWGLLGAAVGGLVGISLQSLIQMTAFDRLTRPE